MINDLPAYVPVTFFATTAFALYLFFLASRKNKLLILLIAAWLLFQAVVALTGFYHYEKGFPPRFALAVLPPLVSVIMLFLLPKGRAFVDTFDLKHLTFLQTFRFPVELVLYWLHLASYIPSVMTFDGRNWDIITGITAPIIGFMYFYRGTAGRGTLTAWNIMGLLLLANIVSHAVLSAPTDFQRLAFDMPNTGVFYFPYIWLPSFLVPLALLSHLISLRQLSGRSDQSSQM